MDDDTLANQILAAHNWDVQAAVSDFIGGGNAMPSSLPSQPVPRANSGRAHEHLARRSISPPDARRAQGGGGSGVGTPHDDDEYEAKEDEALLGSHRPAPPGGAPPNQSTSMMLISLPFKVRTTTKFYDGLMYVFLRPHGLHAGGRLDPANSALPCAVPFGYW